MSDNSNLKIFISKLNDRNLQRKRESGITSYVMFSVLIFCSYKLYKNLSIYFIKDINFDSMESIHLICFISNSLIALYFILAMFHIEKRTFSNLKLIKYDNEKFNLLSYIILIFLILIPFSSTLYSYINRNINFNNYYYYYLGILNVISFLFLLYPIKSSQKNLKIINSTSENIGLKIFVIFISALVIIFSLYFVTKININEKFIFIKIIVLFYTNLFICEKIIEQEKNDKIKFNLEEFEYEIYLKNLNDDQIRERLQKNYIGYLIEYWLDYKRKEHITNKNSIDNKSIQIESQLNELNQDVNENKYPSEFSALKNRITETFNSELEIILTNFKKTYQEVSKIISDGNDKNDLELNELNLFKEELLRSINTYCKIKK